MNDFTKEELNDIFLMACFFAGFPENQTEKQSKIMLKIQSMIENYPLQDSSKFNHKTPIGAVIPFPYESLSEAMKLPYLFPDGRAISRSKYTELFDVLGTIYGEGDRKTTFNIPNFPGYIIKALPTED